jgi:hypothetical protein
MSATIDFTKLPDAVYVIEYDLVHKASGKTYRVSQAFKREKNFLDAVEVMKQLPDEHIVRLLVYKPQLYKE